MPIYDYILLKNRSKCCKSDVQVHNYLYGGLGGYTGRTYICLNCKNHLDEEEIEYLKDKKDE